MNNSFISLETVEPIDSPQEIDRTPWLRQRHGELVKTIEAIKRIASSDDWQLLKTDIFDGVVETLEREMLSEAKKEKPDTQKLANLNGQFVWAKKYAVLETLSQAFKTELQGIKQQLNGK